MLDISSQKPIPIISYDQDNSQAKNMLSLNYEEISGKNSKLLSQDSLNKFDINNKRIKNFTIQNNYITNYTIKNLYAEKCNENLSISKFSLNYHNIQTNSQKNKVSNYTIFRQSFEISSGKDIDSVNLHNNPKKTNNNTVHCCIF